MSSPSTSYRLFYPDTNTVTALNLFDTDGAAIVPTSMDDDATPPVGWNAKIITFASATEAVFATPTFQTPASPVPIYLCYEIPPNGGPGGWGNVLDGLLFDSAAPGRPTPRGEHAMGYKRENNVWSLITPIAFTPKVRRRSKDPTTGVALYGNEFQFFWSGPLPTFAEVQCDVEDITDPAGFVDVPTVNATTYAESSVGMSLLKATSEIIPQDGFEHSLRFRIRYNLGGDTSEWVESPWLAATYILPAPTAPTGITVNVLRDRSDVVPDRIRLDWTWAATNPGDAVEIYAIDFMGKKHLIGEETDNAATSMTVENVTRFHQVPVPPAIQTAYRFGILSKNRTSKSDLVVAVAPVLLTSKVRDTSPATPDEMAGTAITVDAADFSGQVAAQVALLPISDEQKATLSTLSAYAVTAVVKAIKNVVMKGGQVSVADFGEFRAKWSAERIARVPATGGTVRVPAARGTAFTPSIGYKLGTKNGQILTDAQAKALP